MLLSFTKQKVAFKDGTNQLMQRTLGETTDKERRSQNFYTVPCNGDVSHETPIRAIYIVADHTR